MGALAALLAAAAVLAAGGASGTLRMGGAAALLALVGAACLLRHRREARAALVALPLALALVPTLDWVAAAVVAGLGLVAASLSLPARGRSLAAACAVLGLAAALVGSVAGALRVLVDAGTAAMWAPLAALLLLPALFVSSRRFLASEAPA